MRALRERRPEVIVGVGACTTPLQCKTAVASGAQFVVSPAFDEALVKEGAFARHPKHGIATTEVDPAKLGYLHA